MHTFIHPPIIHDVIPPIKKKKKHRWFKFGYYTLALLCSLQLLLASQCTPLGVYDLNR